MRGPNGGEAPRPVASWSPAVVERIRVCPNAYDRTMAPTSRPPLHDIVEEHRDDIKALARKHRGMSISVFGSVARESDDDASDADFLVQFEPGRSLFDLLHLQDDLEELLGCPVDVVSVGGLKPRDDRIRREAIPL